MCHLYSVKCILCKVIVKVVGLNINNMFPCMEPHCLFLCPHLSDRRRQFLRRSACALHLAGTR